MHGPGGDMNTLWNVIRSVLFALLLFIRPLVSLVSTFGSGVSLFGFLFCLIFAREQTTPMYACLGFGVGLIVLMRLYDGLVSLMAPDDVIMIAQQ
jgi:hypothetical protein